MRNITSTSATVKETSPILLVSHERDEVEAVSVVGAF